MGRAYQGGEEPRVGDVVRALHPGTFWKKGDVTTVTGFGSGASPGLIDVECDAELKAGHGVPGRWFADSFSLIARAGEAVAYQPGDVVEFINPNAAFSASAVSPRQRQVGDRFTVPEPAMAAGGSCPLLRHRYPCGYESHAPASYFRLVHRPDPVKAVEQITALDFSGLVGPLPIHSFNNGDKVVWWPEGYTSPARTGDRAPIVGTITDARADPVTLDWDNGNTGAKCPASRLRPLSAWLPEVGPLTSAKGLRTGDVVRCDVWKGEYYTEGKLYKIESRDGRIGIQAEAGLGWDDQLGGTIYGGSFSFIGRPDAEGWIAWAGGECPLPEGTQAEIRYRDGDTAPISRIYRWDHRGYSADVFAFRILHPEAKPAPKSLADVAADLRPVRAEDLQRGDRARFTIEATIGQPFTGDHAATFSADEMRAAKIELIERAPLKVGDRARSPSRGVGGEIRAIENGHAWLWVGGRPSISCELAGLTRL